MKKILLIRPLLIIVWALISLPSYAQRGLGQFRFNGTNGETPFVRLMKFSLTWREPTGRSVVLTAAAKSSKEVL